jgi:DNA-binding CsgD family transcriptional regulator
MLATMACKSTESPLCVFAWGRGSALVGALIGSIGGSLLLSRLDNVEQLTSASLLILVLLIVSSATVLRKRTLVPVSAPKSNVSQDERVKKLAKNARLSKREAEVLVILAKGRSITFVADELYIAKSTATTHARSIYRKLGVHNRQELLDCIEKSETEKRGDTDLC